MTTHDRYYFSVSDDSGNIRSVYLTGSATMVKVVGILEKMPSENYQVTQYYALWTGGGSEQKKDFFSSLEEAIDKYDEIVKSLDNLPGRRQSYTKIQPSDKTLHQQEK